MRKETFVVVGAVGVVMIFILLAAHLEKKNPYSQLNNESVLKAECKEFQKTYDQVSPVKTTLEIDDKIAKCKEHGAWN